MGTPFKSLFQRATGLLPFPSATKNDGRDPDAADPDEQPSKTVSESKFTPSTLFPVVKPETDGAECLQDCATCTISYPSKFKVKEGPIWNSVKPYSQQLVIATGKNDWRKKVETERGSLFEKLSEANEAREKIGQRLMVSASNRPIPCNDDDSTSVGTSVLLLPAFQIVEGVTAENIASLLPLINTLPLPGTPSSSVAPLLSLPEDSPFTISTCPHDYVILLCSHASRDYRCGISAPLIQSELQRHLRPLGLARDLDDTRPGGVGIYFINHVGGHKFAANVIIYRRREKEMMWLARVRPAEVEGLVEFTIRQGKVIQEQNLRGGWREDATSW